jgi:hypothetical protein
VELPRRMFAIVPIMIVIIPIAIGAPTVAVFIPPTMVARVAILAGFVQIMASLLSLAAVATMVFNGFMETMIRPGNALLAIIIGAQTRNASEEQESRHGCSGQREFCCSKNSRFQSCLHPVLLLEFEMRPKSRVLVKVTGACNRRYTESSAMGTGESL